MAREWKPIAIESKFLLTERCKMGFHVELDGRGCRKTSNLPPAYRYGARLLSTLQRLCETGFISKKG